MLIVIIILLLLVLLALAWLTAFSVYAIIALYRIADHMEVELPYMMEYKRRKSEEKRLEETNEQYTQMLQELAEKKIVGNRDSELQNVYNELDTPFDYKENPEDVSSIMDILEYGLSETELSELDKLMSQDN